MKSSEIKAVKCASNDIVKIMSGGVLLWEKEKVFNVTWSMQSRGLTITGNRLSYSVYTDYKIRNGKFYGAGRITNDVGRGTFYEVNNGSDEIVKLVYKRSEFIDVGGSFLQKMYFDVYVGNLEWKYV